jgi:hypothetical protein
VAGRATDCSTFSISGFEKKKEAKNILQRIFGVQLEIRKQNLLDYKGAINVNNLDRRGAQ